MVSAVEQGFFRLNVEIGLARHSRYSLYQAGLCLHIDKENET
jgi:hypothetical protein